MKWADKYQADCWFFNGEMLGPAASAAMAGFDKFPPDFPARLSDVNPYTWNAEARLKAMDEYGIDAQVFYPNVAGFGAGQYLGLQDPELMLLCVQAYNDWCVDWASAAPKRLIPQMAVPFWDPEASVKEMQRAAKMGHKGVIFGSDTGFFKQPKLTDPHWDPLWAAAEDMGLPINFHIASGDISNFTLIHESAGKHAAMAPLAVLFTMENVKALSQIIMGGICHRFPKLNFVSVESGVGWVPFALDMMDWMWNNCGVPKEHPEYKLLPSEYFKRQIYACFWFERRTLTTAIEHLGADNILYESDFPHPTSMSPGPASTAIRPTDYIQQTMAHLPPEQAEKILHGNAARIYHLN